MSTTIINDKCCFLAKRNINSISQYKECLEKFSKDFEQEITLKTKSPIFLDTNVLLRYYSISFTAREKLFQFIDSNKSRIILTPQVQYEFIKNREDVIERFFEQVTNKIPKDFSSDVVNKMKTFLDIHKIVLKDYPFVEAGINKHQVELEKILVELNKTVESKRKEFINLIVNDKLLDLLGACKLYEGLTVSEIDTVRKDFDSLAKSISSDNIDSILNKPNNVFPGLGDIKLKPDDPYGDFVIYHEMMKYMINEKCDVIFLTFDNTKGDWMSKSKSPHLHYIQNMFANTGHIIYIVDAERALGELLNINIDSLVSTDISEEKLTLITTESLTKFSLTFPGFEGMKQGTFTNKFVDELKSNGYHLIDELENILNKTSEAWSEYKNKYGRHLNTLGCIRASLKIYNDMYIQINQDYTLDILQDDKLAKYHQYRHLINVN